jgi:hypothetical protein
MEYVIVDGQKTGYMITRDGRCFSCYSTKWLKKNTNTKNRNYYRLLLNKKSKTFFVDKMVATAYIENPKNKKYIIHLNGKIEDDTISNLQWATKSELNSFKIELKKNKIQNIYLFNLDGELKNTFSSIGEASKELNLEASVLFSLIGKAHPTKAFHGFYISTNKDFKPINGVREGCGRPVNQYDASNGKFIRSYNSGVEAAKSVNPNNPFVAKFSILHCCNLKMPSYKGFFWRYADDIVSSFSES